MNPEAMNMTKDDYIKRANEEKSMYQDAYFRMCRKVDSQQNKINHLENILYGGCFN